MANENIQELKFQVGEAWKGVYSSSTAYGLANVVQDPTGLSVYRSLKSGNVGHPVSDRTWWFCIIDLSSIKAESDRIAALNEAIAQDEALRVAAEELRQQHEAARIAAEAQRDEAEQARVSAEQARVSAESARATAEQQRITDEQGRVSAESARVQAEQARALAETLRANAEDARAAAEINRNAAEQQRIANEQARETQYAADHSRAEADHEIAVQDNAQMTELVERADADHVQAASDHTRADSDHATAASDHTQAEQDHTTAAADHTQAGNDHTRAESDHTRAESDHAAVEVYVDSLGVFDLSKHNAVGGVLATYADLSAALTALNALDSKYKYGGMSFKFVQSSDNKYVQYRCMAQSFTADVTQWQGVDDEPTAGSDNLVKSGGLYIKEFNIESEALETKGEHKKTVVRNLDRYINYNYSWQISGSTGINCTRIAIPENAKKAIIVIKNTAVNITYNYIPWVFSTVDEFSDSNNFIKNKGEYAVDKSKPLDLKQIVSIPEGAAYLGVFTTAGNTVEEQISSEYVDIIFSYDLSIVDTNNKLEQKAEELEQNAEKLQKTQVSLGDIDIFSQYEEYDGAIRPGGFVYTTLSKHKVFEVNAGDVVTLVGGSVDKTFYFVLTDYTYHAYNYIPSYATGFNGRQELNTNQTKSITIPNDGKYIAILVFETTDRTPSKILINNFNLKDDVKKNLLTLSKIYTLKNDFEEEVEKVEDMSIPLLYDYTVSPIDKKMRVYINSLYNAEHFERIVSFKENNTENRHDSTMVISNGIIYDVYCYDPTGAGDNASVDTCKVVLTKYNLSTQQKTTYVVAEKTGVYDGITLDGGVGSPNCYMVGNIIHILFAAKATKFTIIHCEFDTTDDSLSNYSVISLTKDDVSGQLSNTLLNSIYHDLSTPTDANFANCQANSTIAEYNGEYYIGVVFGVDYGLKKWHGFIAKSTDFINWNYVTDVNYGFNPSYEMPVVAKNGYLYISQRPHYIVGGEEQVNYGVLCKWDIANNKMVDVIKVVNCSSKPAFFFDTENNIYLVTNGVNRSEADIIKVDETQLLNSRIEFHYNNRQFNYPCVCLYNGSYYVSNSLDGVCVYQFPMSKQYSQSLIDTKMLGIMMNN